MKAKPAMKKMNDKHEAKEMELIKKMEKMHKGVKKGSAKGKK